MFSLWTYFGYTAGNVILQPIIIFFLALVLSVFGLLPPEASALLGIESSGGDENYMILMCYAVLMFFYFISSLGVVSQTITRISVQAKSFLNSHAPHMSRKGVKNMNFAISWAMFFLPVEALLRIGLTGGILMSLVCFSLATLVTGYFAHSLGYAISVFVFYILSTQVLGGASPMAAVVDQLNRDGMAIYRNNVMADAKEEQRKMQNMALAPKREEYKKLREKQRLREKALKRDRDKRRNEWLMSVARKFLALFR